MQVSNLGLIYRQWDSPSARRANRIIAEHIPALDAIFAVQYVPYAAGQGQLEWVERSEGEPLLVISPRYAIWGELSDEHHGTPNDIADRLNAWAQKPAEDLEDRYTWVIVHALSEFHPQPAGTDYALEEVGAGGQNPSEAAQGYLPTLWSAQHLDDSIEVVTPEELVQMIHAERRAESEQR